MSEVNEVGAAQGSAGQVVLGQMKKRHRLKFDKADISGTPMRSSINLNAAGFVANTKGIHGRPSAAGLALRLKVDGAERPEICGSVTGDRRGWPRNRLPSDHVQMTDISISDVVTTTGHMVVAVAIDRFSNKIVGSKVRRLRPRAGARL